MLLTPETVRSLRQSGMTSAVATAIWHLYLVPQDTLEVLGWAETTLKILRSLVGDPASGVYPAHGRELFRREKPEQPNWRHFDRLNYAELSAAEVARLNEEAPERSVSPSERHPITWGYEIDTLVAQMDLYLPWLARSLDGLHERLPSKLAALEEVPSRFDAVINCTGLGARDLTPDPTVVPVRGQYILTPSYEDTPDGYVGDDDHTGGMAYSIPRGDGVCVGGTEEEETEDIEFVLDEKALVDRAADSAPWVREHYERALREGTLERVVGIRPMRLGGVRLERGVLKDGRTVVHNYGHGGSGFSLAWGCGSEVRRLLSEIVDQPSQ
jgi:D-amino-acid oxidase